MRDLNWREIALSIAKDIEKAIIPLFGMEKAGEIIRQNASGDTTEYVDKVSEDVIVSRLKPLGVNIVSEESGFINANSEFTVVVDPVDGSYNFVHGIPIFGFSMAVYRGKKPEYGMIYEFITGNTYEAIRDAGAFLNGKRISVSPSLPGRETISLYSRSDVSRIIGKVKRIRVLGAIAVELAYLARGSLNGVMDVRNYVRPTDVAAGVLLVKEAGGIIVDGEGKELNFELDPKVKLNIVAASDETLLKKLLEDL